MNQVKCRNNFFTVYEPEEADKEGIAYTKEWRSAKKGDWILTDDGSVLQILNVRKETKKNSKKPIVYVRIGYGEVATYKSNIYAKQYPDYQWDRRYKYDLLRDVKPTVKQTAFVNNLAQFGELGNDGMWTPESIVSCYQNIYKDNNPTNAWRRGIAILRKKQVKEQMSDLMKDKLDDKGLDDDYLAERYKEFIEGEDIPANVRFNALKSVTELKGHFDKRIEELESKSIIQITDGDKKAIQAHRMYISDQQMKKLKNGEEYVSSEDENTDGEGDGHNPGRGDK